MNLLLEQLKALSDETRIKIFKLVERQELCVCQIVPAIELSQPTVSVHLRKLKHAKLVKERRAGQWSYYTVDREGLQGFRSTLETFLTADLTEIPELVGLAERLSQCCVKTGGEE